MRKTIITKDASLEAIKLYKEGWTITKLRKHLKTSQKTVKKILDDNGIIIREIITEAETKEIIKCYNEMWPFEKMTKHFKRKWDTFDKILKDNNIKERTKKEMFEDRTQDRTLGIIKDYNEGMLMADMEVKYNISDSTLYITIDQHNLQNRNITVPILTKEKVIEMYLNGNSYDIISHTLDITTTQVQYILESTGNQNKNKYIKEEEEKNIVKLYVEDFKNCCTIGELLNRDRSTILYILERNNVKMRGNGQSQMEVSDEEWEKYLKNIPEYTVYQQEVLRITNQQPTHTLLNFEKQGPSGKMGAYHCDHMYSTCAGFKNKVPAEIIGNIANLEYLPWLDNIQKSGDCSITLEDLYSKINENKKLSCEIISE